MLIAANYALKKVLKQDKDLSLFRCIRLDNQASVLVLVASSDASMTTGLQLNHEYSLRSELDSAWAVKPIELLRSDGRTLLVFHDPNAEPLDQVLGAPMNLDQFLPLSMKMTSALGKVHEQKLIHKNLQPSQFFVDWNSGKIWISGFGLASRLPREKQPPDAIESVPGSLAYMSPEQTGRMNRSIDSRSDLYSLGIIFYELLTGKLPFTSSDPLDLVHSHLARQPPLDPLRHLPHMIPAIIMKMLAKSAEDRYQSASGLERDLACCRIEWDRQGSIAEFQLGEEDASDKLRIPEKLYGRDEESQALLLAFDRVVKSGRSELILVSGYSGVGKSALVNELHKVIVLPRGIFLAGKYDQYKRNMPYATLAQALRRFVRDLLGKNESEINRWAESFQTAMGSMGQLMIDLIPELKIIIGQQPAVPELGAQEGQVRFYRVFKKFLGCLTQASHPLVLFLDDLQWLDAASLYFLEQLCTDTDVRSILLIGAYRDNEVSPSHALMQTLERIKQTPALVSSMVLAPLSHANTSQLLVDALGGQADELTDLADLIYQKTRGNPFFTIQFLTNLTDEGLLQKRAHSKTWTWDVDRLRAEKFTDNVVDLMVGKIRRFPFVTRESLQHAACLGHSPETSLLALANDCSEEDIHEQLWGAVKEGLIIRERGSYKFLHDRVQEAAYQLIPSEQRAHVHLRMGRFLLAHTPSEKIDERCFEIVGQLNQGIRLITDPKERLTLLRLNFKAGSKAFAATAYASALNFLSRAAELISSDAWTRYYDETFELFLALTHCQYLTGHLQQADASCDLILERSRSNIDRVRLYVLRISLYQTSGRYSDCVRAANDGLALFGIEMPTTAAELAAALQSEQQQIADKLRDRSLADLVQGPLVTDPEKASILKLLGYALVPVHFALPEYFPLYVYMPVNIALSYGVSEDCGLLFTSHASLLIAKGKIKPGNDFYRMAIALIDRFPNSPNRGRVAQALAGHGQHWEQHFKTCVPLLERSFLDCEEVGDIIFATQISYTFVAYALELETLDVVLTLAQKNRAYVEKTRNECGARYIRSIEIVAERLRAAPDGAVEKALQAESAACLAVIRESGYGYGIANYHIFNQQLAVIYNRYEEALELDLKATPFIRQTMAFVTISANAFYQGLALAALHDQATAAEQRQYLQTIDDILARYRNWAAHCPDNYENRLALLEAECARLQGRDREAMKNYDRAINSARKYGFVQYEALACETAARFYQRLDLTLIADSYMKKAHSCYAKWGAKGKVLQLERLYPELALSVETNPTFGLELLDTMSMVRASKSISAEVMLEPLIQNLLSLAMKQSGAQKGCLLIVQDGDLVVKARIFVDGDRLRFDSGASRLPATLLNYAKRTKKIVMLRRSTDATEQNTFAADEYFQRERPLSVLCLPIQRQGELLGLLYLENNLTAGAFSEKHLVALEVLATQAAISIENASLLISEHKARLQAEKAEINARFLAEASALLTATLVTDKVLAALAQLSIRSIADWCVIDIVDGKDVKRLASAHVDPEKLELMERLQKNYPIQADSHHPAKSVLKSGEPLLLETVSDEFIQRHAVDRSHAELIIGIGSRSSLIVAMKARDLVIGTISLGLGISGRNFEKADVGLAQNLADRAALAIDNARLYEQSLKSLALREEFLAVAAHELRTPLMPLKIQLQMLHDLLSSGKALTTHSPWRKLVEFSQRQVETLHRLTDDLLDVSRLESGTFTLEPTKTDLSALVREVMERHGNQIQNARCEPELRVEEGVLGIWDKNRIEQAVTNLLSNAIRYGAGKPLKLTVRRNAKQAILQIQDFGIGIDAADHARIFDRFVRAVSFKKFGGLGIGLYITKQIIEGHGGAIRLDSRLGEGATFTVELPMQSWAMQGIHNEQTNFSG